MRAGASELLLLYPLITFFLQSIVSKTGKLALEIRSFEALALVLELIRRGKEGCDVSTQLADAIIVHARAFASAYPELVPKPKAHYVYHIPMQLRRDGWIIDAFVGERKHIGIKSFGSDTKNTRDYEKTVLFQAFAKQAADLEVCTTLSDRLLRPQPAQDLASTFGAASVNIANAVSYMGTEISSGDLVVVGDTVIKVRCCLAADDQLFLACDTYDKISQALLQ